MFFCRHSEFRESTSRSDLYKRHADSSNRLKKHDMQVNDKQKHVQEEGRCLMKLSVIIPCFNGGETLGTQLEALAAQEWNEPWEVIFSNNNSTDDSLDIARSYQGRLNLRIVDASARQGQPFALNEGIKAATGRSVALCDADDEVGSGWLPAIGKALEEHEFVASRFDVEKLNSARMKASRKNLQSTGVQQFKYPEYLQHAAGGSLGVRKCLHEAVGGFDEDFPYLHDTDFCWKIQRLGVRLMFVPDAVVHYRLRDTQWEMYRQGRNYGEYSVLLYKRYRDLGMSGLTLKRGVKGWYRMLKNLRFLRDEEVRIKLIREFGWRTGRLRGCIKYRTLAL
jgi:glycosyltransferase involved in cell wall biosynthesis